MTANRAFISHGHAGFPEAEKDCHDCKRLSEATIREKRYGDDYIDRTIATVRNHRDADNCWPQWANIFADEIERLRVRAAAADHLADALRQIHTLRLDTTPGVSVERASNRARIDMRRIAADALAAYAAAKETT